MENWMITLMMKRMVKTMEPISYLILSFMAIILILVVVIIVLTVLIVSTMRSNEKARQISRDENKDLLNRVIAKHTSDYKELTHVADTKPVSHKKTLEEQLIEEGALMPGYSNPYPREL